jgi:ACS family sodium-dependent inorganic phosphate cotransporter
VAAVVSSYLADRALKAKKFSRTTVRKVCSTISFCGPSIFFSIQAIWGDNYTVSVVVFASAFAFMSFSTPGVMANCVDIAPAYSGTILGISQILGSAGGYVSTKIVGLITKEEQSFQQWRYVFWIAVGVNIVALVIFLIFASGEVQSWNSGDRKQVEEVEREHYVSLRG